MIKVLNQLGTLLIVTVVTVLVWLYAEDANIQEYAKQSVRLQFVVAGGESEARLAPSGPTTVEVDFDGSNGQYQQFIDATRNRVIKIDLPVDQTLDLQTLDVDMRQQLERSVFRDMGINLTAVNPDRLSVTYEKIVDVTLPIEIVTDTGDIKLSSATFRETGQPPTVTLRVPAGKVEEIKNTKATARIREQDVRSLQKNVPKQLQQVPIELPNGFNTLPRSISTVDLLVTVADDRGTITIDRRPILLSYPSSINERYTVEIDESARFMTAFTLEGPRQQIDLLRQDPASPLVWATIRLTNEEADAAAANGSELTKAVEIIAPQGVVLTSDVVRVPIRVKARTAAATP